LIGNLFIPALLLFQMVSGSQSGQQAMPAPPDTGLHGPMQVACEKCHTSTAWKPIRSRPEFDHSKTRYPLRGLHASVPCQECHLNPVFSDVGRNCQDCHADLHRRKNGAQCDACHRVSGWQVSLQNINAHQDRFPLIGAHSVTDCYSCHKAGAIGQFNRQGLSTECVSCHMKAFQKATAPNHRALGYSTACLQCHISMDSWMTATTPRSRTRK
jgi:hypothetical protein